MTGDAEKQGKVPRHDDALEVLARISGELSSILAGTELLEDLLPVRPPGLHSKLLDDEPNYSCHGDLAGGNVQTNETRLQSQAGLKMNVGEWRPYLAGMPMKRYKLVTGFLRGHRVTVFGDREFPTLVAKTATIDEHVALLNLEAEQLDPAGQWDELTTAELQPFVRRLAAITTRKDHAARDAVQDLLQRTYVLRVRVAGSTTTQRASASEHP